MEALERKVGFLNRTITWKRLTWNDKIADEFRYGKQESEYADLKPLKSNLIDQINIGYKYFDNDSFTLKEGGEKGSHGCLGAPG